MQQTYRMLLPLAQEVKKEVTFSELALDYVNSLNPIFLAYAFIELYKLTISIINRYGLDIDDYANLSLIVLDKCLRTFDPARGVLFTTYFTAAFSNKLKSELYKQNAKMREHLKKMDSLDELQEKEIPFVLPDTKLQEIFIESVPFLECLTTREIFICKLLYEGYNFVDISSILNLSTTRLSRIRGEIAEKAQKYLSLQV